MKNEKKIQKSSAGKTGHGINPEAALTGIVLLFAAIQLFGLVRSGIYLNYVTPRMKPYLYGLSALLFLWAMMTARQLFVPRYHVHLSKVLFLLLPVLLVSIMPGEVEGSSLMRGTENLSDETAESYTVADSGLSSETESSETESPEASETLPGLDEAAKRITIANEDYYDWMVEMDMNYQKYVGYTVQMQGFVYRDEQLQTQGDLAVVRLSMWCCAADLTPMGFLVNSAEASEFSDDEWVMATGTLTVNEDATAIILEEARLQTAQEPEESFVYPTYY
ncbi:MAG: TIGR03943 family protein [Eubacteriales bacterium]|nr:TIGR03943 family protein [Eubacteriales bacterium]